MKKILITFAMLLLTAATWAQAPEKFNYQGVARDNAGAPLANKNIAMRISILDGTATGTAEYVETQNATTNQFGLYAVQIGAGTPVSGTMGSVVWDTNDKFIKVEIDPAGGTAYTDLGAVQLMSVPYALHAATAARADTANLATTCTSVAGTANTIAKFTAASVVGNSQITDNGTSVGVNTPTLSPNIKMQVTAGSISNGIRSLLGTAPATAIATASSVYGESGTGIGVVGVSGSQNGVYGLSTGTLGGTVGVATGTGNGIWGVATGAGVAGFFDGGTTGRGIVVSTGASGFGTSTPTGRLMVMQPATPIPAIDTFAAIQGYSYTSQGCLKGAVSGSYNTSNYGTGIHGIGYQGVTLQACNSAFSTGNQDLGVYGSGNTAGVEGTSTGGIGVVGYNKNSSFAATTGGGNTYGVYGYANTIGGATAPATRYGVYGYATGATTNYAGYFSGNVQITGSISKGSGTFKIDHPQDPENKYLYHSFVESPDMMNVYNGNTTTDANGYATVSLPGYFESLNKDFRYQLTVIGKFAQAIVAEKVAGNKFKIQTNEPNVEVSWQVTGIRNDKYANAHRVIAEVEKEAELKGYYLHAAEWNQPESKSIDYKTRPKTQQEGRAVGSNNIKPDTQDNNQQTGTAGVELVSEK